VAIVTGANRGIGLELARHLLRRGYRVAGLDLAVDDAARLEAPPERVLLAPCDVRSDNDVARSVDAVVARWGRVDVLVNNAAVAPFGSFAETTLASVRESFDVNVFGCLRTISAVLPVMKAQGRGTIANVASVLGFTGLPRLVAYSSTKAAVEALTRSLALELARHGISVKLLHAPLTRTPASAGLGVPTFLMADPAQVARRFAAGLESNRTVVTAGPRTAAWLLAARLAPGLTGTVQARVVERYGRAR
jgi:NAD(P)-dependent dehydrogenase (short-subunit alcohol dehydrogenase family)